ncbi:MAG: flippase-like domain-containing protein [Cyanobacteria bacterium]|nr:flippase-like domain-containing protein [Cyanobacteriota bacterium]
MSQSQPNVNADSEPQPGFGLGQVFSAWGEIFRARPLVVSVGLIIGGLGFYLTAQRIEWGRVVSAFQQGHWLPWLPLAVAMYILTMLMRGYRLKLLVKGESAISVGTASNIIAVGYATNNILPARLGEFARAGMLAERTGLPYILALTVTFLERLLDGLAVLFLAVFGAYFIPVEGLLRQTATAAALIFSVAILGVMFVVFLPQTAITLTSNIFSPFGRKIHAKAIALVTQVNRGFGCLKSLNSAIVILASSIWIWVMEAGFFMLLMPCFGIPAGFIRAVLTMAFTNLGILIPSTPGHVGLYHYICSTTLVSVCGVGGASPGSISPIAIDLATAVSYAVVVHLVFFCTVTVWGILALARYSMEVGANFALTWEAKPVKTLSSAELQSASVITTYPEMASKIDSSVTEFWSGLCESFIPPEHVLPEAKSRETALTDATLFTITQINSMPMRLKVLFNIGITGFKTIVALTNFRFLCQIPLEKRRKVIEGWAFGPLDLARKFMKPIRVLFLFAYYEHPFVKAHLDKLQEASSRAEGSGGTGL